jgi:hypothetical protein
MSIVDLAILPLSNSSRLKGIGACCLNENPYVEDPFSIQVTIKVRGCSSLCSPVPFQLCLSKRKQLSVVSISEEKLTVQRTRELSDAVTNVAMDGVFVCAALASFSYVMFNCETGVCQELFPYEANPSIARIAKVVDTYLYTCSKALKF